MDSIVHGDTKSQTRLSDLKKKKKKRRYDNTALEFLMGNLKKLKNNQKCLHLA